MITPLIKKPLGVILQDAALISAIQIEVALKEQLMFEQMRLGEILASHGWIKQETVDFFAQEWDEMLTSQQLQPIGHYLKAANLLDEAQIQAVLQEQKLRGTKFGATVVCKGWLKRKTIDYFLESLAIAKNSQTNIIQQHLEDEEELLTNNQQVFYMGEGQITLPVNFKTTWIDEDFTWLDTLKCTIAWID